MKKNNQLNLEGSRMIDQKIQEDKVKIYQEAKKLSDNNHAHGHYLLADCYLLQLNVQFNSLEALKLLKQAAELQHAAACYKLARLYLVEHSLKEAETYISAGLEGRDITEYNSENYCQLDYIKKLENLAKVVEALKGNATTNENCLVI